MLLSRTIIIIVLFAFALFTACKKESSTGPQESAGEILPLAVGNTWIMSRTDIDSNGNTVLSGIDTMLVNRRDSALGHRIYFIKNLIVLRWWNPAFYNNNDGLHVVEFPWLVFPPPPPTERKLLHYPTLVGDTLSFHELLIRTSSTNAQITVPAGTFRCVQYDVFSDTLQLATFWLSPNIGVIKSWQLLFENRRIHELQSYFVEQH